MNTHRKPKLSTATVIACILLSATGCKYDGSFFNFSSDSGSPFFGLQLAVDSGSRPPRSSDDSDANRSEFEKQSPVASASAIPRDSRTSRSRKRISTATDFAHTHFRVAKQRLFETTSETHDLNSNVRYSLQTPTTNVSLKTESIDHRLSAF
jgi:hypothetical protein